MNDFMKDQKYYIGANYWASHNAINMWSDFRADVVESDFRKLSEYGVRTLRMFLLWPVFQPLRGTWANETLYELRLGPEEKPLPDTEAGRAGISEEACDNFATLCRLADKYNIKLIVGLLTGHMSFRFYWPPAFEGRNFLSDPTLIKWEIRFVKYFVKRFRDQPSIVAWDLGNECPNYGAKPSDQSYVWAYAITAAIRESDRTRPVVSGYASYGIERSEAFNIREQSEIVDINTTHPYQIFSSTDIDPIDTMRAEIDPAVRATLYESLGGKPAFVEETGSIGYTNCSEKTEADFLRVMLYSTWSQGNHGLFWWCAFDQGALDFAPYEWNNYGSDYGLFRADGSPKPTALEMQSFDRFLDSFEYAELPPRKSEAVCIIPREMTNHGKVLNTTFILAKQANIDITFAHAEEELPDSRLYILPSVYSGKPLFLHRLNELLEKVRNGASLYMSLGNTLFRRLPEISGLTFASRERRGNGSTMLDGRKYELFSDYHYNIESQTDTCETLATDESGSPVYVRNSYGKGHIYFLSLPLEIILAGRPGIFKNDKNTPYYKFYEKFAEDAALERVFRAAHPCVLSTEHPLANGGRIVVAINYSNQPVNTETALKGNILRIHRGELENGILKLKANDAAVLEVEP